MIKHFSILLFSLFVTTAYSQKTTEAADHEGTGKKLIVSEDKSIEKWYGNVSFAIGNFKVSGADSLIYDNVNKKLVAHRCKSYVFQNQTFTAEKNKPFRRVEYKAGDVGVLVNK
jgi:hypothetical protein